MSTAVNIPDFYALVPVEPTREMLDAYCNQDGKFQSARSDWRAMLAAAPTPPVDAVPGEPVAMGCHCDLDPDSTPDGCVLDSGRPEDCTRTKSGKITRREDCDEWKPIRLAASVASRAGSKPVAWADDEGRVLSAMQMENACNHQGGPGKIVAAKYSTPLYAIAPAAAAEPSERAASLVGSEDTKRLDYLQQTGSTVELVPGGHGGLFFRIGGLYRAVHAEIRQAIDAARASAGEAQS
jgi:hypothetical protein